MEKKLSRLFDYQKFAENADLADIIDDVNSRYQGSELSDDDLMNVAAAGLGQGTHNNRNDNGGKGRPGNRP